jgi:hypothetical protein
MKMGLYTICQNLVWDYSKCSHTCGCSCKRNKSPNHQFFLQNLSNVFKNGSKRWTATLALDAKVVSDVAVPRVVGWWMGGIAGMCFGAVVLGKFFKNLYLEKRIYVYIFILVFDRSLVESGPRNSSCSVPLCLQFTQNRGISSC